MPSILKKIVKDQIKLQLDPFKTTIKSIKILSKIHPSINKHLSSLLNKTNAIIQQLENKSYGIITTAIDQVTGKQKLQRQIEKQIEESKMNISYWKTISLAALEKNYMEHIEEIQVVLSNIQEAQRMLEIAFTTELNNNLIENQIINWQDLHFDATPTELALANIESSNNLGVELITNLNLTASQQYDQLMKQYQEDLNSLNWHQNELRTEYEEKRKNIINYYNQQLTNVFDEINKKHKKAIKNIYTNFGITIISSIIGGIVAKQLSIGLSLKSSLSKSILKNVLITTFNNVANKEFKQLPVKLFKHVANLELCHFTSNHVINFIKKLSITELNSFNQAMIQGTIIGTIDGMISHENLLKSIATTVIKDIAYNINYNTTITEQKQIVVASSSVELKNFSKSKIDPSPYNIVPKQLLKNNIIDYIASGATAAIVGDNIATSMILGELERYNDRILDKLKELISSSEQSTTKKNLSNLSCKYLEINNDLHPELPLYNNEFSFTIGDSEKFNKNLTYAFNIINCKKSRFNIGLKPYINLNANVTQNTIISNSHTVQTTNNLTIGVNIFSFETKKFNGSIDLLRLDQSSILDTKLAHNTITYPNKSKLIKIESTKNQRGAMAVIYFTAKDLKIPFLGICHATLRSDIIGFNVEENSKALLFSHDFTLQAGCQLTKKFNPLSILPQKEVIFNKSINKKPQQKF